LVELAITSWLSHRGEHLGRIGDEVDASELLHNLDAVAQEDASLCVQNVFGEEHTVSMSMQRM